VRQSRFLHLLAQRGNALEFPENTLPAFRSAIEIGARFLALDVQLSSDGVAVVSRDVDLTRTTDMAGNLLETPAARLVLADASEPGRFGARFLGTRMPRLADALGLLENRPDVTVFVELRRHSLARFGHDTVVSRVLETIRPFRSQCVLISSELPALLHARNSGGPPIGWVLPAYDDHSRLKYEAIRPQFLFCDLSRLPPRGTLWRGPWRWVVCDVSAVDDVLDLAARGVDFVGTVRVRALSKAMHAHAAPS
jgi:glycerophosphoryl diester phosphodiesterase